MIFLLYRRILNLHKGLPQEMRVIGDNYVRDEFKRHKNSNAVEADVFLTEWTVINISRKQTNKTAV